MKSKVLLCYMPFGPADWPNLALGLLKAGLVQAGIDNDVRYFSVDFAQRIGKNLYTSITEDIRSYTCMVGEWIFSAALFGSQNVNTHHYLQWARETEPGFYGKIINAQSQAEPFLQECLEGLDWEAYDIIGFSSSVQQQIASLALAKRIKGRWQNKAIIFGGNNVEGMMGIELLREFDFLDFVCVGEGDGLLPEFVHRLRNGQPLDNIPGLAFRRNGQVYAQNLSPKRISNLDTLPFPDYDDFFRQFGDIFQGEDWRGDLPMETARGCWWGEVQPCTYCALNGQYMCYRRKSIQRSLNEMEHLAQRYAPRYLFVVDNIPPRDHMDLLSKLEDRDSKFKFYFELRANVSKAQLSQMKRAGAARVLLGIESLSSPILQLMRKGMGALTNIQALKWCREFGIMVCWNILYGFPLEEPSEYQKMAELIPSLTHLMPPQMVIPVRLLRHSSLFDEGARVGLTNVRPIEAYKYIYPNSSETFLGETARRFDFDYADGRDPSAYIKPTWQAVEAWWLASQTSILTYLEEGERLRIFDTRTVAIKNVWELDGYKRKLYLLCDRKQHLKRLQHIFPGEAASGELQETLDQMVGDRLMVTEDGYYLSLAVSITDQIELGKRDCVSDEFCMSLSHDLMGTKPIGVTDSL